MSNHVAAQLITLGPRPAAHSDSKVPSCGNQPAHIRLTRVDKTRSTPPRTHLVNEAAAATTVVAAASPCPLDTIPPISERRWLIGFTEWAMRQRLCPPRQSGVNTAFAG